MVSKKESRDLIIKVILWRIISVIVTIAFMWVFVGDIKSATWASLFLHAILTFLNYNFELFWEKQFSKKKTVDLGHCPYG